jgi:general secretion pathway protein G
MKSKNTKFKRAKILIKVGMLVILAVYVAPPFSWGCRCDSENAKFENLAFSVLSIRTQLELYKIHHDGAYPTDITAQLTGKTDADGTLNASGAYGPYLHILPSNPYVDDAAQAARTTGSPGEGWDYAPATGAFLANEDAHPGHGDLQRRLREDSPLAWESPKVRAQRVEDRHPGHMPRWSSLGNGNGYIYTCCAGR